MKWEDICSNCGLCCHEKAVSKDFLIIFESVCDFYDEKNKRCSVYDERFDKCDRCLKITPLRAAFASYLPSSCAYVLWAKRHHIRFRKDKEVVLSSDA